MALNPGFDANGLIDLDADQVIRLMAQPTPGGGIAQKTFNVGGVFVPEKFDKVDLTYIPSGPGAGEIGTCVYSLGGTAIATLTLAYDGSNRLISVERS